MKISSPAFDQDEKIPSKYSCDDIEINPALNFSEVPEKAQSLALIVDDPDAPSGRWTHWILWNIDPGTKTIDENSVPRDALQGKNDFSKLSYGGPCPPSGTHHYFFKLYALDAKLDLREGAMASDLENAMKEHIIESAELVGIYTRGEE